jgi:hypothetical protein
MAYSLKSFVNANQGQQSATSFTQPIKMPLSQSVLRKGIGRGTPLSEAAGVPWSGVGDLTTSAESISDFGINVQSAPPPALEPGSRGEAIANSIAGAVTGVTEKGIDPLSFISLATPPTLAMSVIKGVKGAAKGIKGEEDKGLFDDVIGKIMKGIFGGKQPSAFQQDIQTELTTNPVTGLPLGEEPADEAPTPAPASPDASTPGVGDFGW